MYVLYTYMNKGHSETQELSLENQPIRVVILARMLRIEVLHYNLQYYFKKKGAIN